MHEFCALVLERFLPCVIGWLLIKIKIFSFNAQMRRRKI